MGSVNCENCGNNVGFNDKKCSHCGKNPAKKKKGLSLFQEILIFGVVVYIGFFVYENFIESDESKREKITERLSATSPDNLERIFELKKKMYAYAENKTLAKEELTIAKKNWETDLFTKLKGNISQRDEISIYKSLLKIDPNNQEYNERINKFENAEKIEKQKIKDKENLEFQTIYMAKESIKSILKDSDSAKFRDVIFINNTTPVACGEVNSKNSFGAFAGFTKFVSAGTPELTFLQSQVKDFHKVWNKFCAGK